MSLIKRRKPSKLKQSQQAEIKERREAMLRMFHEIWNERPHKCFETGVPLGNEPLTIYFHHILPKEKFSQYELCKWNIVLLAWNAHDQIRINDEKCPKTRQLYLELLEKHYNFELTKENNDERHVFLQKDTHDNEES